MDYGCEESLDQLAFQEQLWFLLASWCGGGSAECHVSFINDLKESVLGKRKLDQAEAMQRYMGLHCALALTRDLDLGRAMLLDRELSLEGAALAAEQIITQCGRAITGQKARFPPHQPRTGR